MSISESQRKPKVLAVSSGGGHWVQLLRLRPAFVGCDVCFVTVSDSYAVDVADQRFRVINDATRWNKLGLLELCVRLLFIIVSERPDVVVSTGAAPGYFAFRIGRLLGARTLWIDSIANVEQLSMTGQWVMRHTDLCLTQWEHLATHDGPMFKGRVL